SVPPGSPAPCKPEPARPVELHELADGGVPGNHLDAVEAARARLERRLLSHPAGRLLGVDQELPHRLGACVDRELALDCRALTRRGHASPSPLVRLLASAPRAGDPRTPRGTA